MSLSDSQDNAFNSARLKILLKRSQRDSVNSQWNRTLNIDKERYEASRRLSESEKSVDNEKKSSIQDDDVIVIEPTTSNSAKSPAKSKVYQFEKVNDPKEESEIKKLISKRNISHQIQIDNRQAENELKKIAESLNLKPIEKIVKEEENILYNDCSFVQEGISEVGTTESKYKRRRSQRRSNKKKRKTLIDSYLGTVSTSDDLQISKFATELSGKLKLPYVFMTREEFERFKSGTQVVDASNVATKSNIEFDGITVKGDKLIGYVLNDSNFNEKNAIKRDEITNLGKKINNMQSKNKRSALFKKSMAFKKKNLKKKHIPQFGANQSFEFNNGNLTVYRLSDIDSKTKSDDDVITDIAVYNSYLYTCTLSGRCTVYNMSNNSVLNSMIVKDGTKFINCVYHYNKCSLNVVLGSDTRLFVYDALLKKRFYAIDLKSEIKCCIYRYHNMFCGLNSGEVVTLNKNINIIQNVFRVSNKKLSCLSSAIHNQKKMLLVGSYDGKISIVLPRQEAQIDGILVGHDLAPLSIKCRQQFVYSCSVSCQILIHSLETRELLQSLKFNDIVTSICISGDLLICSSADNIIKCFDINLSNGRLKLCQQYYGSSHNARILCLEVRNKMIYYGDDKGTTCSFALDLMNTNKCGFIGCEQIFAKKEYLLRHLTEFHYKEIEDKNHVQCNWSNCNTWCSSMELSEHLKTHL